MLPGLRVIRGPDWRGGDTDGGEGHLGTVIQLLGNHTVRVLWDMGQESTCSTGADGKFDLRVFDSAQIGVRHPAACCAECGQNDFFGMLWRCQNCADNDLCPLCYHDDKHDLRHQFLRIDTPGTDGQPVPKRKTSVRSRAMGMFPGSTVARGKDWQWGGQDGGQGSEGEVIGYENVSPDSSRNLMRVQWSSTGISNSYRLGFHGNVDLTCVEEELGPFYYRDHLPVLDTTKQFQPKPVSSDSAVSSTHSHGVETTAETDISKAKNHNSSSPEADDTTSTSEALPTSHGAKNIGDEEKCEIRPEGTCKKKDSGIVIDGDGADREKSSNDTGKEEQPRFGDSSSEPKLDEKAETAEAALDVEKESFAVGDKVAIKVPENVLADLQEDYGGCSGGMIKAIGHTGEIVAFSPEGGVFSRFQTNIYRYNPKALIKVAYPKLGTTVRIREDEKLLKVLNCRVGWKAEMRATIGKVGLVLKIDSNGDVLVSFGHHAFLFAPASCIPAPDLKPDALGIETDRQEPQISAQATMGDTKKDSTAETSTEAEKKSHDLYRMLRERIQSENRLSTGTVDIRSLFSAIKRADHSAVRSMCLADRSLLEREYHGMTPLVVACLKGNKSLQVVTTLLELGANVNHGLPPFATPLAASMEGQSEELVDILLEAGADPFAVDPKRHTYIHIAAAFNLPRSIQALAARGVGVNLKDDYEDTALHVAIEKLKNDSVTALLQLSTVDLHSKNLNGFPPLLLASYKGNARAVELILGRDKSLVSQWHLGKSRTPLHMAASHDHDECIRVLVLQGGADVNLQDSVGAGYAPIHLASIKANFRAAEALLEMGADVHVQNSDGDTPLHLAIGGREEHDYESKAGQEENERRVAIACMLISKGAYVDMENRKGRSPLNYGVPPVREGVKRFIRHNEKLVKRKGSSGHFAVSLGYGTGIKQTAPLESLSASAFHGQGRGQLKEALKGMGLPCGLCGTSKSDVTLQPCQHKCVCSKCSVKVTICPLCDEEVKDRVVTGADEQTFDAAACKQM